MLMITGGVIMNFITAIIIFAMILFKNGEEFIPVQNEYLGYNYCQTALNNGFENGDRIISIDNEIITQKKEIIDKLVIEGRQGIKVLRNGHEIEFSVPKNFGEQMIAANEKQFMSERIPFVIDSVLPNSIADKAGLQNGDSIVAINGNHIVDAIDIMNEISRNANKAIFIKVYRNNQYVALFVAPDNNGKIGVQLKKPLSFFKTSQTKYGFVASFPAGWRLGIETLTTYIKQLRFVFTKAGAASVGGFGSIGNLFPAKWDWTTFWTMTAFISIILAFMNILPIPILDGGYLLFLIYEAITRRKPSDKFMETSLNVGMYLILALLIYANGNDVFKWLQKLL
jgi:regulator of sigma E protease